MKLHTTIEIDEIETEVLVEFENASDGIEILKGTEMHTGVNLPILFNYPQYVFDECAEYYADTMAERRSKKVNYNALNN